jgi:hypothetical protein
MDDLGSEILIGPDVEALLHAIERPQPRHDKIVLVKVYHRGIVEIGEVMNSPWMG